MFQVFLIKNIDETRNIKDYVVYLEIRLNVFQIFLFIHEIRFFIFGKSTIS